MKDEVSENYIATKLAQASCFLLPPSFFPRVPLSVPSWSNETHRAVLGAVFSRAIVDGPALCALKSSLIDRLGVADAMLCGSGSLALELALRTCGVGRGDEVIIPAFCCSAVVRPIMALEAVPVLADVGAELNLTVDAVAAALTRKTKAVVVPHLFGNPAEIAGIVSLAHERNIRVIDDAAQALGATVDGRPVGSFGDLGILSFGAEKVCFGVGGGALVASHGDVLTRAAAITFGRPSPSAVLRKFLRSLILHRWRAWTCPIAALLAREASPETVEAYCKENMANLASAVALTLLASLQKNIAARRERIRAYRELLGDEPNLELVPHRPTSAALVQVVRVLKKRRGVDFAVHLVQALRSAGFEVQGSYVPVHRLPQFGTCVWDQLAYTERVWPDLIELPCEPTVRMDHLERIAAIVKRTLH